MIRRVLSMDEIHRRTAKYDIVIAADPALCAALNARIREARIGPFAVTPRELAARHAPRFLDSPLMETGHAVVEAARALNAPVKKTHHHAARILHMWENLGSREAAASFLKKHAPAEHKEFLLSLLEVISALPTVHAARERFRWNRTPLKDLSAAVVEPGFLSPLDKTVLPPAFREVTVFTGDAWELPPVHLFADEYEAATRAVEMIAAEHAEETAVICNPEGPYVPLVLGGLRAAGVAVKFPRRPLEAPPVKNILALIDASLHIGTLRVRDFAPLAALCGVPVNRRFHEYSLAVYAGMENAEAKKMKPVYEFLRDITKRTYGELLAWLASRGMRPPSILYEELDRLGFLSRPVSPRGFEELVYYLRRLAPTQETCPHGVLIVDSRSASFVSRPVCFFLGLDETWSRPIRPSAWTEGAREEEKDIRRFTILLQQGERRFFFVPAVRRGEPVVPTYYFSMLSGRRITDIRDPFFTVIEVCNGGNETPSPPPSLPPSPGEKGPSSFYFSRTSLNEFTVCPRRFAYTRIAPRRERAHLLKGDIIHQFAAFYASHPEHVKSKEISYWVDIMLERYREAADPDLHPVEYTRFTIAARNIMRFVDGIPAPGGVLPPAPGRETPPKENVFAEREGLPLRRSCVEVGFRDAALRLTGIVDLVAGEGEIVDYKSGSDVPSASSVLAAALPGRGEKRVDFQPILYLAAALGGEAEKEMTFTYFYCLGNIRDFFMEEDFDVGKNTLTVRYIPCSFGSYLAEHPEKVFPGGGRKRWVPRPGDLRVLLAAHPLPPGFPWEEDAGYAEKAFSFLRARGVEVSRASVEGFLAAAARFRRGRNRTAYVFREDMESFTRFVREKHREVRECFASWFPPRPIHPDACTECEFLSLCIREDTA